MRTLFRKYKKVLQFIVLFLGSYVVLSMLYWGYLNIYMETEFTTDPATRLVAKQSSAVIRGFGYEAEVIPNSSEPTMRLMVEKNYVARIVEGCNAISIIILFMAFVIAFSESWKKTLLFLFAGAVLIYGVNVVRIVILAIALYEYPEQKELLHGVVFPGLIYGMVFLLWMVWVRMLSVKRRHE